MFIKRMGICLTVIFLGAVCFTQCTTKNETDSSLDGTWVGSVIEERIVYKFRNGKFENSLGGMRTKGTYAAEDGKITFNPTHVNGAGWNELAVKIFRVDLDLGLKSKWYTNHEFIEAVIPHFLELGLSERDIVTIFERMFSPFPSVDYSVDKESLTLTIEGESIILSKNSN